MYKKRAELVLVFFSNLYSKLDLISVNTNNTLLVYLILTVY